MVEREPQLRTLAPYLTEAAGGHGRLVFVGGEAGGGKSTFVRSFVARAGDAARSGFGVCDGSSTPAPSTSARDAGGARGRPGGRRSPVSQRRPAHVVMTAPVQR